MATYIVSSTCQKGVFAVSVHVVEDELIKDPECVNEFVDKANLVVTAKAKISDYIYRNSILRDIRTHSYFNDGNSRFHMEFGIYATLSFLAKEMEWGDNVIVAGAPYIRALARGAYEIVEDFETALIKLCYKQKVIFTDTQFRCDLYSRYGSIITSKNEIRNANDFSWMN